MKTYFKSAIPKAVLANLKDTKPMVSNTAREMRRVLEQIKQYARNTKQAGCDSDLQCHVTLDLIEQKLSDKLVRGFRRWLRSKHSKEITTVDMLISFLQEETELEEHLASKFSITTSYKNKNSNVCHLRSSSSDFCALCENPRHRFVDCDKFMSYTPQQRTDAMRRLGRCFTCLAPMHRNPRDCRYRRRCANCTKSHHTLLACVPQTANSKPADKAQSDQSCSSNFVSNEQLSVPIACSTNQCKLSQRYSPATFVEILGSDGIWHKALALFDTGSDVTLIKRSTVNLLKLDCEPHKLKFGTAGGGYRCENSATVSLWIRNYDKKYMRFNISAFELDNPAHQIPGIGNDFFQKHTHLKSIEQCVPKEPSDVDILIGFDNANLMTPTKYLKHQSESDEFPTAVETKLGWYIYGPCCENSVYNTSSVHYVRLHDEPPDIRAWYEADIAGVKPTRLCACSEKEVAESQFIKHVRETMHLTEEKRIEVSLPWKEGFPFCLKFNRNQALAKLNSLEHRLMKSQLFDIYEREMKSIIDTYAERVSPEDIINEKGWYLDHFPVIRPGKSTACRIVWNAASLYDGVSLNDGLCKGPDLLNNLFQVLIAWRANNIALVGDIKKMFNQIQISLTDRVYHRFLWRDNLSVKYPSDFQWKRLPFGDRPAPDLSISALHFLADKHSREFPVASHMIKHHSYVDDLASSFSTDRDAFLAKRDVNAVLATASFEIKGWHSNSKEIDEYPSETTTTVLGHHWDKSSDMLKPKLPIMTISEPITKRIILSLISQLWDPLGIFSPIGLKLRLLMQSLWAHKLSWDEQVDNETKSTFLCLLKEVKTLQQFQITRGLRPAEALNEAELHGFCDGGELAYGAVIWLRWQTTNGIFLRFVVAKSFVAPVKRKSIPRLELLSALVLARLVSSVKMIVNFSKVCLWSDSATVLHWLNMSHTNFKPFVSSRIQEIKELLIDTPDCFRYIKSSMNPADSLTKPISVSKFFRWHEGPNFLMSSEPDWLNNFSVQPSTDDVHHTTQTELRKPSNNIYHLTEFNLIDFEEDLLRRLSSWKKLVRVVAWLMRPLKNCRSKSPALSATELIDAKNRLFWLAQESLRRSDEHQRKKKNLQPSDEHPSLLRIHGRLTNFQQLEEAANPIALPSTSKIVRLYAQHMHELLGHQGYRVLIVNLRAIGIYILRGKQIFKSISAKCVKCRIARRELLQQQMGQLPAFRFKTNCPPFTSVALDYFGPVKIKKTRNIVIDGCVLLISCNTTRVIHLELTQTQSTDDFLMAWRRFVTKRGVHPIHAYSDQGKAFVGAQRILNKWFETWDKTKVSDFMTSLNTTFQFSWEFNVPQASHMNGAVESLIRSCRKALETACDHHKRSYSFSEWETIISEINYLVNSRPLFPNAVDDLDEEPFTGNTLLYPHGQPTVLQPEEHGIHNLRLSIKAAQSFINVFWDSWMRNMPPQLLLRSKWFRPRKNLKEGDYVIVMQPGIKNKAAPRGLWEHALVEKTIPGSDGLVRKVELRLSGQRKLTRPIHKLCLIATAEELK